MTPIANTLWRWIETELLSAEGPTNWGLKLDYGETVGEPDVDSMVEEKFKRYKGRYNFKIEGNFYYMKAMPVQNKLTRGKNTYKASGTGESIANILAYSDNRGEDSKMIFNLHISIRKTASVNKAIKAAANKDAEANGGWQTQ